MGPKTTDPKDLLSGGILQCAEAITLGMPLEVWKTHLGSNRTHGTMQAFSIIYKRGGIGAFWSGWQPKMVESFFKGGILLFAKDAIIRGSKTLGAGDVTAGLVGGFGGGIAQVVVLGPCTYLVTASVTGEKGVGIMTHLSNTMKTKGVAGFYQGGTALMLRQGSNWASRQGLTDLVRSMFKKMHGGDPKDVKLTVGEEVASGIIGGAMSTWNQPFEVLRIEAQSAAARGQPSRNIVQTATAIIKENGPLGLFRGIIPRMGLGIWQTLFMVSIPYVLKPYGLM